MKNQQKLDITIMLIAVASLVAAVSYLVSLFGE